MRTAATKVCAGCGGAVLGKRTVRVLEFVIRFCETRGRYPKVREVMRGLRLGSSPAARYHIVALRDKGLLSYQRGVITGARRAA